MKNLKLGILACGMILLVQLLTGMVWGSFVELLHDDTANALLVLVGLAMPTAMGVLGLARPPLQIWQAIVALAGFGVVAVKMQLWEILPHLGEADFEGKLAAFALVVGLVLSLLAIAKPEERA